MLSCRQTGKGKPEGPLRVAGILLPCRSPPPPGTGRAPCPAIPDAKSPRPFLCLRERRSFWATISPGCPQRPVIRLWAFPCRGVPPSDAMPCGKAVRKAALSCCQQAKAVPGRSPQAVSRGERQGGERSFCPMIRGQDWDQIQFRPGLLEHPLPGLFKGPVGEHRLDITDVGHRTMAERPNLNCPWPGRPGASIR